MAAKIPWAKIRNTLQKEAIEPLGEKKVVTLSKPGSRSDATNPQDGVGSPSTFDVTAVTSTGRSNRRGDVVNFEAGQIKLITTGDDMVNLTEDPHVGWGATIEDLEYRVVDVTVLRPGTTTIGYVIMCER